MLQSFGCSEKEATLLQKQIFSLSPTLAQVRTWVETKDITKDDQNKKELESLLTRYQKHRDLLNNPQQREKIKQGFIRNDLLSAEEADILLTLIEDNLKDPKKGEFSKFTMPGQLSLGYSLDYELKDGRLIIKGITMATRFSEKNIFEDMVGYVLIRR